MKRLLAGLVALLCRLPALISYCATGPGRWRWRCARRTWCCAAAADGVLRHERGPRERCEPGGLAGA
jgi:hypothetical protein